MFLCVCLGVSEGGLLPCGGQCWSHVVSLVAGDGRSPVMYFVAASFLACRGSTLAAGASACIGHRRSGDRLLPGFCVCLASESAIKNKICVLNHAGQGYWSMPPLSFSTAPGGQEMGLERALSWVTVSADRCKSKATLLFSSFPYCELLRKHTAVRVGLSTTGAATRKKSLVSRPSGGGPQRKSTGRGDTGAITERDYRARLPTHHPAPNTRHGRHNAAPSPRSSRLNAASSSSSAGKSGRTSSCGSWSREGAGGRSICGKSSSQRWSAAPARPGWAQSHHRAGGAPGAASTPSECCSRRASARPPAACPQR
ncbi:hypothetical protein I4F81_001884 [Pyropia yezoensis]|uniref:Uncharacterized protein n=1 Tax=Pyropia yezoensis TaxID=2788 RepID=A0ACC3BP54_PYRYE|nr:hypothetical protein I4F81_001884 [Neopyropia yezoensis]